MSITPIFSSACDLAQRIPDMIAGFLQLDISLSKKFREESATDAIVASLLQLPTRDIVVITPNEKKTGADFDIVIVDETAVEAIRFRIQSKRLTANKRDWEISSYRELAHPNNTGSQSSTLLRSASHEKLLTIPLYAFYNPQWICEQSENTISGVELASGYEIGRIVRDIVKAKPKRTHMKRISFIRQHFFPLTTILCPPEISEMPQRLIPTPGAARQAVENAIEFRRPQNLPPDADQDYLVDFSEDGSEPSRKTIDAAPPKTVRLKSIPTPISRAIERRDQHRIVKGQVKRNTVVLISQPR